MNQHNLSEYRIFIRKFNLLTLMVTSATHIKPQQDGFNKASVPVSVQFQLFAESIWKQHK